MRNTCARRCAPCMPPDSSVTSRCAARIPACSWWWCRRVPSIHSFAVSGNKEIKTEDLTKSLRNVGLAQGKILNRSTLEDVRQFLTEQYFSHGRYNVRIDVSVEEIGGNLVDVRVDIAEGKRAKIRQINVVGNERFDDQELLDELELKKSNLLSFYRDDDHYSRQSLEGDLEKIRSHYLDRGYADFEITSTQVALAPDKDDLFITINVFEGDTWKTGAVKLAGRFVVPEEILRQYVIVRPGEIHSQRLIAASEQAIRNRLGEAGYRLRGRGRGAGRGSRDPRDRTDLPDRAQHARLCAAHRVRRAWNVRETKSCGARFASSRAGRCRTWRCSVPRSGCSACRTSKRPNSKPLAVPGSEDLVDVEVHGRGGAVIDALRRRRLFRAPVLAAPGQFHRQQSVRQRRSPGAGIQRRPVRPGVQRRAHRSLLHRRWRVALAERLVRGTRAAHLIVLAIHHPDLQHGFRLGLPDLGRPVPELRAHLQPRRPGHRVQQFDAVARLGAQQRQRLLPAHRPRSGARHHSRHGGAHGRLELREPRPLLFPTRGGLHRFSFAVTPPGGSVELCDRELALAAVLPPAASH